MMPNPPMVQCEQCGDEIPEGEAFSETRKGYRETVTLYFCKGCAHDE